MTVVWLFQESERISSDRLFRVRAKQPFSKMHVSSRQSRDSKLPKFEDQISVGDFCVFRIRDGWRIGKVVQFVDYKEQLKRIGPTIQTQHS